MYTFFHGWRRKTGCVVLLMVLAFSGLWIRSQVVESMLICVTHDGVVGLFAEMRGLSWARHTRWKHLPCPVGRWEFASTTASPWNPYAGGTVIWRWQWLGFDFGERQRMESQQRVIDWTIPYWSLAMPLTLLAAYLIVWTPTKATEADSGPVPQ